jgi:hypothetical protein
MSAVDGTVDGWMRLTKEHTEEHRDWVYCLWCTNTAPPRAIGASQILYIGQGGQQRLKVLRKSVKAYLGPPGASLPHHAFGWLREHNTVRQGKELVLDRQPLKVEVWVKPVEGVGIGKTPHPRELVEALLLNDFYRRHGELPLLNRKHEGWVAAKVMKALAQPLLKGLQAQVGDWAKLETSHVLSNAATASKTGGGSLEGEWFALVWFWPESWSSTDSADEWAGRLALLRANQPSGARPGDDRPERLKLEDQSLWLEGTHVAAWCPADCLAGASATSKDRALTDLWSILAPDGQPANALAELARRIDRAPKSASEPT